MNNAWISLKRVLKFVVPVTLGSIAFNIPKFFEATIVKYKDENGEEVVDLEVTPLRKHPDYIKYYSTWARLIVNGILPFVLLSVFNTMIYRDIKVIAIWRKNVFTITNLSAIVCIFVRRALYVWPTMDIKYKKGSL